MNYDNAKYGISKRSHVVIAPNANTTKSSYMAKFYKVFREFETRADARAAKRAYKKPQNYAIINLTTGMVVR